MQSYADDRDVFIRSMASRGHAGGLASTSSAAAAVLDACGFDLAADRDGRHRPERGRGRGRGGHDGRARSARDPATRSQAIKAGLLEVADLVVVNKGDKPGAPADRRAAPRDAHPDHGPRTDADPARPQPKRPEVLITTAATGEGVPELLVALDRHRAAGEDAAATDRARLARAEAQVWAILGERLRGSLVDAERRTATEQVLAEVAAHRLDPYAAADRLLAALLAASEVG